MAGHALNWVKVGKIHDASAKGRMYISNATLAANGLTKADLGKLSLKERRELARMSPQPGKQAVPAAPKAVTAEASAAATLRRRGQPLPEIPSAIRTKLTPDEQTRAQRYSRRLQGNNEAKIRKLLSLPKLSAKQRRQLMVLGTALILTVGTSGAIPPAATAALAAAGVVYSAKVARDMVT